MLTVIVEAGAASERLPHVLAQLTSAAVEGLVREVLISGGGPDELLVVLREETGAELAADLGAAIGAAKAERLLVLPASLKLKPDWLEALGRHLRSGGGDARILGAGGLFSRGYGVVITRAAAARLAHPDLDRLRRQLPRGAARLG